MLSDKKEMMEQLGLTEALLFKKRERLNITHRGKGNCCVSSGGRCFTLFLIANETVINIDGLPERH